MGLLSILWCLAVTYCPASRSEQALTSSASTCSTHSTWAFSRIGSCAPFGDFDLLDTGSKAKSQIVKETLSCIRRMLSHWYPIFKKKLGDNKVTRVGSVFNNLIGSDGERVLRLEAAGTRHFLPHVCRCHKNQLQEHVDASALLGAGDAAVVHGCDEARATATVEGWAPHARGLFRHPYLPSAAYWSQNDTKTSTVLGDDDMRSRSKGNPRHHSAYFDESLNKSIIAIAASCYRVMFERRLFAKFRRLSPTAVGEKDWW